MSEPERENDFKIQDEEKARVSTRCGLEGIGV